MGSVLYRDDRWVIEWKDATGRYRQKRTKCRTKAEARRMVEDLERQAERQRLGLEPLRAERQHVTFGELMDWWWERRGSKLRSPTVRGFLDKHLRPPLGHLPLQQVTADAFDKVLSDLDGELSPRSINHLRAFALGIFKLAARPGAGIWSGNNPISDVPRRKVPKRHPEYLRWEEVPAVLAELSEPWRWVVATAIYTGMRKGEVFGLERQDVDLDAGVIHLRRSWDSDTVKDGEEALLPIARGLRPHLEAALAAATKCPGRLLYPRPDGSMHRRDVAADDILRRAMGRAGVVTGYQHRCRRRGCGFNEERHTAEASRCPRCDFALWAKPLPRHVRFHDLRHTTATLLLKDGVPLAVVQRVMRHSDPALTAEIYGHLDLEDMRRGLDRLTFEDGPPSPTAPGPAPVLRVLEGGKKKAADPEENSSKISGLEWSGRQDLNLRPLGPEAGLHV